MRLRTGLLALLATLALPAPASAATVELRVAMATDPGSPAKGVPPMTTSSALLDFQAAPGEANSVSVAASGGAILVRDTGAPLSAGTGCQPDGTGHGATCPLPATTGGVRAFVDLEDGDDRVALNGLSGRLRGGAGADVLGGGELDDVIDPGLGADVVDAGAGLDELLYRDRGLGVTVDLGDPGVPGGEAGEGDRVMNFEAVATGAGADSVSGNEGANRIAAGAGDDYVDALGGPDNVEGEAGDDDLRGGAGDDDLDSGPSSSGRDDRTGNHGRIDAGAGDDDLVGREGGDIILGGLGDDEVEDFGGENAIEGGPGDDDLSGGAQADTIDGGPGHDRLHADGQTSPLRAPRLPGAGDRLVGGSGNDRILGDGRRRGAQPVVSCGAGRRDLVGGVRPSFLLPVGCERVAPWGAPNENRGVAGAPRLAGRTASLFVFNPCTIFGDDERCFVTLELRTPGGGRLGRVRAEVRRNAAGRLLRAALRPAAADFLRRGGRVRVQLTFRETGRAAERGGWTARRAGQS